MANELAIMPLADYVAACNAVRAKANAAEGTTYTASELEAALSNLSVGTDTTDANATATDIEYGFTAYVNNVLVTGTKVLPQLSAPILEALGDTFRVNANSENGDFATIVKVYASGTLVYQGTAIGTVVLPTSVLNGHLVYITAKWCGVGFTDSPASNTIWGVINV